MKRMMLLLVSTAAIACHPAAPASPPRATETPAAAPPPTPETPAAAPVDPCAWLADAQEERAQAHAATARSCAAEGSAASPYCGMDDTGEVNCSSTQVKLGVPAPWHGVATVTCSTHDSHYGEGECSISIDVADEGVTIPIVSTHPSLELDTVTATVVAPGLLVRAHNDASDWVAVCRAEPPACTDAVQVEVGAPPPEELIKAPVFK